MLKSRLETKILTAAAVILMVSAATSVWASDWLSGPHFNLNVIGGPSCGSVPSSAGSGDRHTIFVPLTTMGDLPGNTEPDSKTFDATDTSIYLLPSSQFGVCSGDACTSALTCSSAPMGNHITDGAVFELPCDTIEPSGTIGACNTLQNTAPAEPYCIYAEGVGKPGGSAQMTTCALDTTTNTEICGTNSTPVFFSKKS